MISFKEFKDNKESKNYEKAVEVILKGINLQKGKDFWSDFISLCSNAEGMAALLDIPREKVTALPGRINDFKSTINSKKEIKIKDRLIKTGDKI